jgi:hypothetical protein
MEQRKKTNAFRLLLGLIVGGFILLVIFAEEQPTEPEPKEKPSVFICKANYYGTYPLQIDSLKIMCIDNAIVLWQPNTSNIWAVNGTALERKNQNKWQDVRDIWIDGESLMFIVDKGQELCN